MTKKPEFLKLATVAVIATGLLAGCATDGSSEANSTGKTETTQAAPMKAGPSAAAKNAIYLAKVKNGRAIKAGYEWRDTGKVIKAAEKAAAKGDNDKAIALANKARQQAVDAIDQSQIEADRYEKIHGTASLTSTMMSNNMESKDAGTMDSMMDASGSDSDYTVIPGDNLWDISAKNSIYGNPYQWPLIYKANAAKIKDADLIYSGQVFTVPSASSSDISAAINHAKTRGAWTIGESEQSDLDYVLGFK